MRCGTGRIARQRGSTHQLWPRTSSMLYPVMLTNLRQRVGCKGSEGEGWPRASGGPRQAARRSPFARIDERTIWKRCISHNDCRHKGAHCIHDE